MFSDQVLHYRDLVRDILPAKVLWRESVLGGHGVPHWNHFTNGGIPYLAQATAGPLHPLNFLFLMFPLQEAARVLSFFLIIHYLVFAFGFYVLLRFKKLSQSWSILGAASLACSGLLLSLHNLGHMICAMASLPWLFLCLEKQRETQKFKWALLAGIAIGWPLIAGDPQTSYLLGLAACLFALFALKVSLSSRFISMVLMGFGAFGASAAQLLPTFSLTLYSGRGGLSIQEAELFSFHPIRFIETLVPLFFGNRFAENGFWAEGLVNFPSATPFVFSTYLGFVTVLGLASPLINLRSALAKLVSFLPLSLMGLVLVLASLGVYGPLPLYRFLFEWIPGFSLFRYPERLLVLPLLGFGYLGIRSFAAQVGDPGHKKALSWTAAILSLACIGGFISNSMMEIGLSLLAREALVAAAAFYFLAFLALRFLNPKHLPLSLLALLAAEIFLHGNRLAWTESKEIFSENRYSLVQEMRNRLSRMNREILEGAAFRFSSDFVAPYPVLNVKMDQTTASTFSALESLQPSTGALYGLETTSSYSSLTPKFRDEFVSQLVDPLTKRFDAALYAALMGAKYLLVRGDDLRTRVEEANEAQPYIHFPQTIFFATDLKKVGEMLRSPDFHRSRDAVVGVGEEVSPLMAGNSAHWGISILSRNGRSIRIQVKNLGGSKEPWPPWLQVNESYDPYWRAYTNSELAEVHRSNGWAMAIKIPSSNVDMAPLLEVELRYENPWIRVGSYITFIFFFLLLLVLVTGEKVRSKYLVG